MFVASRDGHFLTALPGIERQTLVHGERTLMTVFRMQKGTSLPQHSHPYEQTGYLVSGRMRLTISGESFDATPGAGWCIPRDAPHSAEIAEDSLAVEVFAPVRPDYLP